MSDVPADTSSLRLASAPLAVQVNHEPSRTVVALRGELDVATGPALGAGVREAAGDVTHLVIDLRELEFMDASGLRALVRAQSVAHLSGRAFAIVPGDGPVQTLLMLTGMTEQFTVLDSRGA